MPEDGFDPFAADSRHLSPQQWTALRKYVVSRAEEERKRVIRQMGAAFAGALWSAWNRLRRLRRARSELYAMTERELRDIGLSRSGIEAAISQIEAEPQPAQPKIRDPAAAPVGREAAVGSIPRAARRSCSETEQMAHRDEVTS
jgi:uncharacterized protein YjiS (DUF1127 family)